MPALWPLLRAMGKTDAEAAVLARAARLLGDPAHFLPVALSGGLAVGYAWAQDYGPHLRSGDRAARLHDLFVEEDQRRTGAGTLLMLAVTDWVRLRGTRWLQWQASAHAVPFYERIGLFGDPCPDPGHPFFEMEFQ
ncbi:MAG: GNAT family N-acetyltransferase [Chloroflexia bacterium]